MTWNVCTKQTKKEIPCTRKTGEIFSTPLYGDTGPDHPEYDIIRKNGTKEHCYQVMERHSVICR
ncbi:MAG: hypothetical protein SPK70_05890 [Succinivibrio dextrinosolvens]|uniref:hypothetical protein n=1 Tax=Succinivibrio dextrinosolvens TaxID=83771 RepID=UPI0009456012|nr:hypothetical protein [Succinivibrio dextrinosolvens]MDY6419078.1 hypothetical protein [Succinivibrio dextrinosolvens]MDY6470579.1 hypothetical protein [Succinivibrio dextrinosolvens]